MTFSPRQAADTIPAHYTIGGLAGLTIAAGASANLTITLNADANGEADGSVVLHTSAGDISFDVTGQMTVSPITSAVHKTYRAR